jgi:predicted TIM-barrel enzyme
MAKAAPDGLCISANAAGQDVDDALIASIKEANSEVVVLCNTGCRVSTIAQKLSTADAAVVGTTFKRDGVFENRVDVKRVKEFMEVVYDFRKTI